MVRDKFGRPLTSLRISVTNDCNLNCFYCHREGCSDGERVMSPEEIGAIVQIGAEFGIRKVKLTGGEPLLREDIADIVAAAARSPISEVSMATNGTLLAGRAEALAEAGLARINISLDTVDPECYASITGKRMLDKALAGVDAALAAGLSPVKLNMVVLHGVNDDEVERMIEYAVNRGVVLQLIELLLTPETADIFDRYHHDLGPLEQGLRARALDVRTRRLMQARRKYIIDGGEVEVVNPMHNSEFCAHCTRLRLTPDGYLKSCLMRNDNLVDVLTPVRSGDSERAREAFREVISQREPYFRAAGE